MTVTDPLYPLHPYMYYIPQSLLVFLVHRRLEIMSSLWIVLSIVTNLLSCHCNAVSPFDISTFLTSPFSISLLFLNCLGIPFLSTRAVPHAPNPNLFSSVKVL